MRYSPNPPYTYNIANIPTKLDVPYNEILAITCFPWVTPAGRKFLDENRCNVIEKILSWIKWSEGSWKITSNIALSWQVDAAPASNTSIKISELGWVREKKSVGWDLTWSRDLKAEISGWVVVILTKPEAHTGYSKQGWKLKKSYLYFKSVKR